MTTLNYEKSPRPVHNSELPVFPLPGWKEKAPSPTWVNPAALKPRIVWVAGLKLTIPRSGWNTDKGAWLCHNEYWITAQGSSPEEAYVKWLKRMQSFYVIKRHGWWNKRGAQNWYNANCWAVRSYIGDKRICGYLPQTDELVLQG